MLPTGIGGDALRIVEHSRRRPEQKGEVAAAVLLERVIGSAGVLVLVAIGLVFAIGRYDDVQFLILVELVSVLLVAAGFFLLFSTRARRRLGFLGDVAKKLRVERPARSVYEAMHVYRERPGTIVAVVVVSVVLQFVRIISIWLCGEAVGLDLPLLVYVILGPLLFLVMMVPFTINGLGVREAFFVAFLGRFGVDRRRCLRDRLSLLRRDDGDVAPRRPDPALAQRPARVRLPEAGAAAPGRRQSQERRPR